MPSLPATRSSMVEDGCKTVGVGLAFINNHILLYNHC